VLHLDLTKSSLLSVLPWMTMALCANLGGWLADSLVDRGYSVTLVRKASKRRVVLIVLMRCLQLNKTDT
jgi:hypothetical protein